MKNGKGYKDTKHTLNCPPNSLSKMSSKGGNGDVVISQSLSKMSGKGSGGTRPEGFSKM